MKNGYIDIHTHGIGKLDSQSTRAEDYIKLSRLYEADGAAGFLPTIYTGPIGLMRRQMEAVREAMVLMPEGVLLGVHLEGPFINPKRAGAQGAEDAIEPTREQLKRLVVGYEDIIRIITVAPEIKGGLRAIEWLASQGITVQMGHSEATHKQATEGKRAGARGVTHLFNAMGPMHHRAPGLVGLALTDDDLYVEVIADGIHIAKPVVEVIRRTKPMDRVILVSDSVSGPQYKGKVLQGAKRTLGDILKRPPFEDQGWLKAATEQNPRRYLGL